jgi:hypothetical protein
MLLLLVFLQVVPWLVVAGLLIGSRARQDGQRLLPLAVGKEKGATAEGKPGPWGQLEYVHFGLELPDEFVFVPPADQPPVRWFFSGYTKDQTVEFLRTVGVATAELEALEQKGAWTTSTNGTSLVPGDEMILGLSPAARGKIYTLLADFSENVHQVDPVWFRPGLVDEQLQGSDLSEVSIGLLKSLLYPQGESLLLFADFEPLLRKLADEDQQRRFVKAIHRKRAVLARLRIDAKSNVDALVSYWGVGGRHKDLTPLLGALRRLESGWECLNIVYLLPQFMRERLYNYPFPSSTPEKPKEDCFRSAMNAFNTEPDARFNDMRYVQQVLEKDYYTVLDPSQLGDLIFLSTREGLAVHAAVYVADDIVFTKNGDHYTQPWILMHVQDMLDTYAVRFPKNAPLNQVCYRKKSL